MGYNFLYGLWKYSWDADCELFLKILQEETKEDVYTQQIQLQASTQPHSTAVPVGLSSAKQEEVSHQAVRHSDSLSSTAGIPLRMTSSL